MTKLRGLIKSLNKKYSEMYEQRGKASDEIRLLDQPRYTGKIPV